MIWTKFVLVCLAWLAVLTPDASGAPAAATHPTCPAGYISQRIDGGTRCVTCPVGRYISDNRCRRCPRGFTTSGRGASSRADCYRIGSLNTYTNCPAGQYLSDQGCKRCGTGEYQEDTGKDYCHSCPSGKTTLSRGSTSIHDCVFKVACGAGYKRLEDASCEVCAEGTYQPEAEAEECVACPPATWTNGPGKTSVSHCQSAYATICSRGTYKMYNGLCQPCAVGYYQDIRNQATCKRCPHGKTTAHGGSYMVEHCYSAPSTDCPAGSHWVGNQGCVACDIGMYQSHRGQSHCLACDAGKTTLAVGSVDASDCIYQQHCYVGQYRTSDGRCQPCAQGTYQNRENQAGCLPCPDGSTTSTTGAYGAGQCYVNINSNTCFAGTWKRTDGRCVACAEGYYQPRIDQGSCLTCPAGKTTDGIAKTSLSDCVYETACQAGSYRSQGGTCQSCDVGYYQDGANRHYCHRCPGALTTRNPGANSVTLCVPRATCLAGTYVAADGHCEPCARGYYQHGEDKTYCFQCALGFTTINAGSQYAADCLRARNRDDYFCHLPKDVGTCYAAQTRYFLNVNTGVCESFTYSGCNGNRNNFATRTECENTCKCHLKDDIGSSHGNMASYGMFYYDCKTYTCKPLPYAGYGGNGNRFNSVSDCVRVCG